MKLVKFRIKNYKSIIDSGPCYLSKIVTILAGKNESGKTSILEALRDFSVGESIDDGARPVQASQENTRKPEISATFALTQKVAGEILEGIDISRKITKDSEIEIVKTFPAQYDWGESALENPIFGQEDINRTLELIESLRNRLSKTIYQLKQHDVAKALAECDISDIADLAELKSHVESAKAAAGNADKEKLYSTTELADEIGLNVANLEKLLNARSNIAEAIRERAPRFILFDSFEDILPNEVPFSELENNSWVRDLATISNLNIDVIKGEDNRANEKHATDINIEVANQYSKFWKQDESTLSIKWDSTMLRFWIYEDNQPYKPNERSKGRQWHLSFYIKVSARAKNSGSNIILIDEPGLYLHAKAQKDVLRKLEDSAGDAQIVFSTHSPYLLEPDKLERVRLVVKDAKKGTTIVPKPHAAADYETITPIFTAIAHDLGVGILAHDKVKNIVVEGPSDMYYMNAFAQLLGNQEFNFIFGGGALKMPVIGSILHGWGCEVVYLFDNDAGKKAGEKHLIKDWWVKEDSIVSVLQDKQGSIEDVFSKDDFREFVLPDDKENYAESNSEHVKSAGTDKVLIAMKFLEQCRKENAVNLGDVTQSNVEKLFERITNAFHENEQVTRSTKKPPAEKKAKGVTQHQKNKNNTSTKSD